MAVVLARIEINSEKPVTAGLLFDNNVVLITAPIFSYMVGWSGHKVKEYVDKKGWKIERVQHTYIKLADDE